MNKLIISVTANEGAMRQHNRHVPWTPEEIAADALRCRNEGASLVHYHGRTHDGGADHSAQTYARIIAAIKARCDILQLPSLANIPGATAAQRLANLLPGARDPGTRPDLIAVEPGCSNMDLFDPVGKKLTSQDRTFINSFETVNYMLAQLRDFGIAPCLSSFNISWTRAVTALLEMRAVPEPVLLFLVMGGPSFIAAHPATSAGLKAHLDFLPRAHVLHWVAVCHGANALEVAAEAIERGGHVAIGLGDYPYRELGEPSNADLVAAVRRLARDRDREPASPQEVRAMLESK